MSPLTPSTASLQSNQQVQFNVTVSGSSNTALIWSFLDSSGTAHYSGDSQVGTVTTSGLYTAPVVSSPTSVTILVAAAADTSISRSATIQITPLPPPVGITMSPTSASVQSCSTTPCGNLSIVDFSAQVTNTTDTSVEWEVDGQIGGNSGVGSISTAGVYTAPAVVPTPATVTVLAVAHADTTKTAQATVTITPAPPPIAVHLNSTSITLMAGQSFNFAATDNQGNPLSVSYSATCTASDCGSFTPTTLGDTTYTAPSTVPNNVNLSVTVTATATADTTKTATASVTVMPPVAPSLEIDFNTSAVVTPGQTLPLTAKVNNAPSGSGTPVFNWTQSASTFCVSSDEEGTGFQDNCGDSDGDPTPELDGPGEVTPASAGSASATYQAPQVIWNSTNGGIFYPNGCTQASAANTYVYITVRTTVNSVSLTAFACVHLAP